MRHIIGAAFVSLDGVMQAPGGPTEDPTGGFEHGGWLFKHFDDEIGNRIDQLIAEPFDLLLGRRTYDIFAGYWPFAEGDPDSIGRRFDRAAKFVLTRHDRPLAWQNSHRLPDLNALADVKRRTGPDLLIQGSSTLYPQLLETGLIDRLVVMTFSLVLGQGKRLFGEGTPPRALRTVAHRVTAMGNIIAEYEPSGTVETGSFATIDPSPAELERRAQMEKGTW